MKRTLILLSAFALSSLLVAAQPPERGDGERPRPPGPRDGQRPPPPGPFLRGPDRIMQDLIPPPLIFQAGREVDLTEDQRQAIREELDKARDRFEEAEERLRGQMEALSRLLREPRVNETQAIAQLEKVLAAENEIKKAQLASLIRVNNLLTPEQKEKLREFAERHRPPVRPDGQRPPFGREREGERGGDRRPPPPPNP